MHARLPCYQDPEEEEYHLHSSRKVSFGGRLVRWGKGATHQHTKHLCYQPPVARDARPVAEEFFLGALDVVDHVFSVLVISQFDPEGYSQGKGEETYVLASMR